MEIATIELASIEVATITTLSYIPYHILTLHEIIIAYETNDSWTNDWSKRREKKKMKNFQKFISFIRVLNPRPRFRVNGRARAVRIAKVGGTHIY